MMAGSSLADLVLLQPQFADQNEEEVGDALDHVLRNGLVPRQELYICSKVWCVRLLVFRQGSCLVACHSWVVSWVGVGKIYTAHEQHIVHRLSEAHLAMFGCRNTDHSAARVRQACLKSLKASRHAGVLLSSRRGSQSLLPFCQNC